MRYAHFKDEIEILCIDLKNLHNLNQTLCLIRQNYPCMIFSASPKSKDGILEHLD